MNKIIIMKKIILPIIAIFLTGCSSSINIPEDTIKQPLLIEESEVIHEENINWYYGKNDCAMNPADQWCPAGDFRTIGRNIILGNKCTYYHETKKLIPESPEYCSDNLEAELSKEKYNLVSGCLYKGKSPVYERTILYKYTEGEFHNEKSDLGHCALGYYAMEWTRFISNEKTYIFFYGFRDCGNCTKNGPYVVIDNETGDIKEGTVTDLPHLDTATLSPNGKKVVFMEFDGHPNNYKNDLLVYDLEKLEKKVIHTIPEGEALLSCGHGCFFLEGAVKWLNNEQVKIKYFKEEEDGYGADYNSETGEYSYIENSIILNVD